MLFRVAIFTLALASSPARAEEPRVFTFPEPVRERVSLEDTARLFHFPRCPRHDPEGTLLLPAVATLRGYRAHSACETPPVRYREVVVRQAPDDPRHTDVLFIGNSLTYFNDLPAVVAGLSQRAGDARPIRAAFSGSGGLTLEQHWERGDALEAIYAQSWDYVVLQEQSGRPLQAPEKTEEFIRRFDAAIRESGARAVLFMPWTHETSARMQGTVAERFRRWAGTTILLAPVGSAWASARTARPGLDLYDDGGNHPTLAGTYLAAAVLYAAITGRNPEGLPHAFAKEHASDPRDSLAASDASFLQEIAARAAK